MSLIDSIENCISSWFGYGDLETKEKSALTTSPQTIQTHRNEHTARLLGHKLKKAQVVFILDDSNSPLVTELIQNQFSKKDAKLITSYKQWWSLKSPLSILQTKLYSSYSPPSDPLKKTNLLLENYLFPLLLLGGPMRNPMRSSFFAG